MRIAAFSAIAVSVLTLLSACGQKTNLDEEFAAYEASVEAQSSKTEADNAAFLAQVAAQPGVVKLPSGLMYKVIASPNPTAPQPSATDTVIANYEGKLPDGEIFDSSYRRGQPAVFSLAQVVPGWQIGIPLMHKGDSIMLYVPPELGYGADGKGAVPPNSVMVFKVELLDIKSK